MRSWVLRCVIVAVAVCIHIRRVSLFSDMRTFIESATRRRSLSGSDDGGSAVTAVR